MALSLRIVPRKKALSFGASLSLCGLYKEQNGKGNIKEVVCWKLGRVLYFCSENM